MKSSMIAVRRLLAALAITSLSGGAWADGWDGQISQFGKVQEVLGEKQHKGRVELGKLVKKPHCYAVGALAGLTGEATIVDGQVIATCVESGLPVAVSGKPKDRRAASLAAAYVPKWVERKIDRDVSAKELERFVHDAASEAGLDPSKPFPYLVEGELTELEMHVINGACPMRAKRLGRTLPDDEKPFHGSFDKVTGRLVGVYAEGSVGSLTCHGSQAHTHVILKNKDGKPYTGHVESVGVAAGAVLRLPVR